MSLVVINVVVGLLVVVGVMVLAMIPLLSNMKVSDGVCMKDIDLAVESKAKYYRGVKVK